MKIVFVYLGTRGVCNEAWEIAVGFSHSVKVLCVISRNVENYKLWKEEEKANENLSLISINAGNTMLKGVLGLLNFPLFYRLHKEIMRFAPDAVYSYMGHPWEVFIVPFIRCANKLRSIHDTTLHVGERTLKNYIIRLFDYNTKYIVVYSQKSKRELVERGYKEDHIIVTSLPSTSKFIRNQLDTSKHSKFMFWGRMEAYKGIDVLLNSVGDVFKKHPDSVLIMAGRGDLSSYTNLLQEYKNNILLYNKWIPDEDIPNYFNQVDFLVLPYTAATQSGVVNLAYSFGKPVIVSDSGALPEQIIEGMTGLCFPVNNRVALSDAINSLLDNDEILERYKENAYNYARSKDGECVAQVILDAISNNGIINS